MVVIQGMMSKTIFSNLSIQRNQNLLKIFGLGEQSLLLHNPVRSLIRYVTGSIIAFFPDAVNSGLAYGFPT
jgi:hypothetical protein